MEHKCDYYHSKKLYLLQLFIPSTNRLMNINEVYTIVQFIANKNQSGYISPDDFNNAFNLAQQQYFRQLIEDIQGWDANRKRIRLPMGNAQPTIQKVAPFIIKVTATPVPGTGILNKPADLANLLAVRVGDNTKRVWRVEHDRIADHLSSAVDPPAESPIFTEYGTSYQFYPLSIGTVSFDYLRTPPDAVWAYTMSGGRPIYDAGASIDPLWADTEITEVIIRVLLMFGISIQAPQLVQYYGSIKNDGQ